MIIEAMELSKRFAGCEAIKGLSLSVPEGSAYALIGANGAGKTTTIKILCNLLAASHGKAQVLGVDSTRLSPKELAMIGYVSESQRMPARLTVREYLDYLRPFYPSWDVALEASTIERFALPLNHKIGALSHGMRMKFALACALPFRPKLLVMDEPFNGIDAVVREDLLAGLLEQAGETTIFISSHDLAEIEGLVSHVAFLEEGKLSFQNAIDELKARFRAVRVTFDAAAAWPPNPPPSWLDIRIEGNVLAFTDSDFSDARLRGQLAALPGTVRNVLVEQQSLLSIFIALAREKAGELKMVMHIFRKDLRLLWPFIAGATVLQLVHLAIGIRLGLSPQQQALGLYQYWGYACFFASQLLVVLAVQQDSLVGARQDWLMRPVARRDMWLAKTLFILVAIQAPIFVFDLVIAFWHGSSPGSAVTAALFDGMQGILTADLIAFVAAVVTETLPQAIIFLLVLFIVKISGAQMWQLLIGGGHYSLMRQEIVWIPALIAEIVTLAAALVILPLQYLRRRTSLSRLVLAATVVLLVASNFLPWTTSFALAQMLSFDKASADNISLNYSAGIGREKSDQPSFSDHPTIFIPIHVANLPAHSILHVADFSFRISDKDGHVIYRSNMTDFLSNFQRVAPKSSATLEDYLQLQLPNPSDRPISIDLRQSITIPDRLFEMWKDRPVHINVTYSIVLEQKTHDEVFPAIGGNKYLAGYGQCASNPDERLGGLGSQNVSIWCFAQPETPHCLTAVMADQAGQKDPPYNQCFPDYVPAWWNLSAPLEPARSVAWYVFGDHLPDHPVTSDEVGQSHFVLTAYESTAHFTQDYNTPEIRLGDLTEQFVCRLRQPSAPRPMGSGTIVGLEDPADTVAGITRRQGRMGGAIDPHYAEDKRALVQQSDGWVESFDIPPGMNVHRGDRVTLQASYRNPALPCSYIPIMIAADLGAAPAKTRHE